MHKLLSLVLLFVSLWSQAQSPIQTAIDTKSKAIAP
ncbi:MAG: hypothetical protein RLZZ420_2269, partial [Bacteroidota bacterium]